MIERSPDGSSWTPIHTTPANVTSYTDTMVAAGNTYYYRVRADNDGGASNWSNPANATTLEDVSVSLTASGYKKKGKHMIDLAWSGASDSGVDIYRDGALLVTTVKDGEYTDATGNKGKRTYTYQVCDPGPGECSNSVNVRF